MCIAQLPVTDNYFYSPNKNYPMKRIYSLLIVLLTMCLGAMAQDTYTLQIQKSTGDWTAANPARTWAATWQSSSAPFIYVKQAKGANNMNYYDGSNIKFFNSVGANTTGANCDYTITCDEGWYVSAVKFDFFCDNDQGVAVALNGDEPVECFDKDASGAEHIEATDIDPETAVSFNVATINGATTFANTLNFYVTLTKKSTIDVAWAEFTTTFNKYSALSEEDFPTGTEPGCYDEAAVQAFFKAIADAAALDELDHDDITLEQLQAATKAMDDAYEAMIASKVAYSIADGLYRLRTAMQYNDGNIKYLLSYTLDQTKNAYWGTPVDAEDNLAAIWRITKSGDDYDLVSEMSQARFATIPTSGAATLTQDAGTLMAIEAAGTDGTDVFINLRLTTAASGSANYVHQNGHGGGNGTGSNIVGWYTTYSSDGPGGSEWVLEPVSESELQSAQAAYQEFKVHQDLVRAYNPLFTTAAGELAKAQDGCEGEALITDAEQFSSPFSDADEGQDFGALIDGETSSYWHSDWHNGNQPNHSHYLQIDLSEAGDYSLLRMTITRRPVANDHITRWGVFGSDDAEAADEEWTEVASLFTPFGVNTETVSGLVFDSKGFKHLRFYIDGTTTGRGYGHMSEFQLYKVESLAETTFGKIGVPATTLESVLTAQKDIVSADLTQDDYNTLKSAYDAFHAKFSDPTEMRQLIEKAVALADGVIEGNNPGQWSDTSTADVLKATISAAQAYDEAGNYDPATTADFVSKLNTQMEATIAAANPIKTDTWYRFRFGTEEEFEAGGWDLVAGNGTENDEALWGKYVTVAKYVDGVHDALDLADVRIGSRLYFLDSGSIDDDNKALFRFVDAGEQGYLLQNKATSLFLKAAGTSGAVTLSITPSFYKVTALGYGQNLIASTSLSGAKENYLHAQVSQNTLVTWDAYVAGSRSALYIEEVGSASGYSDDEFTMDIRPGQFYAFCYPAKIEATDGTMYNVTSVEGTTVSLSTTTSVSAGEPFIYLYGDLESYDGTSGTDPILFKHGYEFVKEPQEAGALVGSFVANNNLGKGKIVVAGNRFEVTDFMGHIAANEAYINSTSVSTADVITVIIDGEVVIDGVRDLESTLKSVNANGDIYTLDGRRVAKGNVNTLRTLGRGVYIINGVKVAVK